MISSMDSQVGVNWKAKFNDFANIYHEDLPNPLALDAELQLWETYWITFKGTIPNSAALSLKVIMFPGFENITVALKILGTLPVTSCECERSFSALRRPNSYTSIEEVRTIIV